MAEAQVVLEEEEVEDGGLLDALFRAGELVAAEMELASPTPSPATSPPVPTLVGGPSGPS